MHISYRHRHADLSFDEIAEVIGRQTLEEAQAGLQRVDEGDVPLDLESMTNPDESSPTKSDSTKMPSGSGSEKNSENSDESPATTGTSESGTSSPQSGQETTEALAS
jgi:hypothetical protein